MKHKKLILSCSIAVIAVSGIVTILILINKNKDKGIEKSPLSSNSIMSEEKPFNDLIDSDNNFIFSDGEYLAVKGIKEPVDILKIPTSYDGKKIGYVDYGAFKNDTSIKEIVIEHPLSLLNNCFSNTSVEKVSIIDRHGVIPDSMASFYPGVFSDCKNLKEFECDAYIEGISNGMFYNCENLEKVILKCPIEWIPNSTFNGCKSLTEVFLPATVSSISDSAFDGCDNLKIISGYENSYAQTWAIENGYEWQGEKT